MLKFLFPIFFCLCACQSFGIKDSDTIEQAEMKIVHVIETKAGVIAEPPASAEQPIAIQNPRIRK